MIILTVLKIIGIILLVIIGIILLLVCLVLFVPVRYRGTGTAKDGNIIGEIRITWLLHALSVIAEIDKNEEKKLTWHIRIFGIPIEKIKALFTKKKSRKKVRRKLKKLKKKDPEKYEQLRKEAKERREAEEARKKTEAEAKQKQDERIKVSLENEKKSRGTLKQSFIRLERKVKQLFKQRSRGIGRIFLWIISLPGRLIGKIRDSFLRLKSLCAKIKRWKDFIFDAQTLAALKLIVGKGKKLLKHIKPKKIEGTIRFGMEDPFETGSVLAAVMPFYSIWGKSLEIIPDFEDKIIDGHIEIKGRVFLFFIAYIGLTVYFDKNVKHVITFWKGEKEAKKNVG